VAVHGGQVDDGVTLSDEGFQFLIVLKVGIFEWDALVLGGGEAEGVVEMCADEARLAGDAYFDHISLFLAVSLCFSLIFADFCADLR